MWEIFRNTKRGNRGRAESETNVFNVFHGHVGNELSSVTHPELSNDQTVELDVPKHDPEVKPVLT